MSPPTTNIRNQLAQYKAANSAMETSLGNGALAKKSVVAQQMSDQLWTDPVSQEVYKRYPVTITSNSTGVTTASGVAASKIAVWKYSVPTNVELQLIPQNPDHYIIGAMKDSASNNVDSYEATIEVWDQFLREYRGCVWVGTTTEINDSKTYRQNGYPLVYNGDKEIRCIGGDVIQMAVTTPTAGTLIDATYSSFSIRAYHLILMRQG